MATKPASIDDLDPRYLMCRAFQHAWMPTTVDKINRGAVLVQGLRCQRCKAVKSFAIHRRTGTIVENSTRMKYPPGYLLKGAGRRTAEQNGLIRLRVVTGVLE